MSQAKLLLVFLGAAAATSAAPQRLQRPYFLIGRLDADRGAGQDGDFFPFYLRDHRVVVAAEPISFFEKGHIVTLREGQCGAEDEGRLDGRSFGREHLRVLVEVGGGCRCGVSWPRWSSSGRSLLSTVQSGLSEGMSRMVLRLLWRLSTQEWI